MRCSAVGVVTDPTASQAGTVVETATGTHPAAERGGLRVADRAIQRIATHAAEQVAGVTRTGSGLDRVVGRKLPRADSTVAGDQVRVSVDVAVEWPHAAGEVARGVRAGVAGSVGGLTGLHVLAVDVTVARFVQPAQAATRRVR